MDLGLTDEEWLEMTPRQLQALRKRQVEIFQRQELLVGILASTTANYSFCRPETPIQPSEFMLHPLPKPKPQPLRGETLMAMVHALPKQAILTKE